MPNILCINLLLVRDKMTRVPKTVTPWALPVMRSQWGDSSILVVNDEEIDMPLPDAADEYARLRDNYGVDEETKQPHVDLVYGHGPVGIKALQAAINDAAKGKVPTAEFLNQDRADSESTDPLADSPASSKKK